MRTKIKSITFNTIIFLVVLLSLCFAVFIGFLMNGFKLSHLSFGDLKISQLYLKYDKKLFVEAYDINYSGSLLDCNLSLEKNDAIYTLNIKNLEYKNLDMNLSGTINLTYNQLKQLQNTTQKEIAVHDLVFYFDKKLPAVKSNLVHITSDPQSITLDLEQGSFDGIPLSDPKIVLKELDKDGILKIDFDTHHLLDLQMLKILAYYEVALPLLQKNGENLTHLSITIPFEKGSLIDIAVDTKSKNGTFIFGDNGVIVKKTPPKKEPTTKVRVGVDLHNTKLLYENYALRADKTKVVFANNKSNIGIDQITLKDHNQTFFAKNVTLLLAGDTIDYKATLQDTNTTTLLIDGQTNLTYGHSKGSLGIASFNFENKISLFDQTIDFQADHNNRTIAIQGDINSTLLLDDNTTKMISLRDLTTHYAIDSKELQLHTHLLFDTHSFWIDNNTSLDTKHSSGTVLIENLKYKEDLLIQDQSLHYFVLHDPLEANISSTMEFSFFHEALPKQHSIIGLEDLKLHYTNNKATLTTHIKESDAISLSVSHTSFFDTNISQGELCVHRYNNFIIPMKVQDQNLSYLFNHTNFATNIFGNFAFIYDSHPLTLKDANSSYADNILLFNSTLLYDTGIFDLDTATNLDDKKSHGTILIRDYAIKDYLKLHNEKLSYQADFKDDIIVKNKEYDLTYTNKSITKEHHLTINKLNLLASKATPISDKQTADGSLNLKSDKDMKNISIILNNIALDINSSLFPKENQPKNTQMTKQNDNKKSSSPFEKITLKGFNTRLSIDGYDLNSTMIEAKIIPDTIDLTYTPAGEKRLIFHKKEDKYSLTGDDLSSTFVHNFIKKDIFNGGRFSFMLNGNDSNLNGTILLKETTIKDVQILNNLILFINTTPALINPLLALPTLFRMSETNFDLNGYYVRDGIITFDYNFDKKLITLPHLYTKSKMIDFKGKGFVDIGNEKIDLGIDVIFLKDYSKFINHIPILGYIITGDDGNFVTNVDIRGDFEKQDFETHTVKNASDGAYNAIKRTLYSPIRLLEQTGEFLGNTK